MSSIITGLDIGSSTIKGVVAEQKKNGTLGVLTAFKQPSIGMRRGVLEPAVPGDYTITPWKIWYVGKDADIQQVQHAFMLVEIPSRQAEHQRPRP